MYTNASKYIFNRDGVFYYFSERALKQLQHCQSKQRILIALNTKSRAKALKHAKVICQRLDERWLPMKLDAMGLNNAFANDARTLPSPRLSEAMQLYLQLKGIGKARTFQQAARRNVGVVVNVMDDERTADYNTIDTCKIRDATIATGFAVLSVKRTFITIKAITN